MAQPASKDILSDEPKFQAMCKAIFDELDKDKSGSIDVKELEGALTKSAKQTGLPPPSKQDVQDAVKLFDKNKDGTIQLKEFVEVTRESYKKAKAAAETKGGKVSIEDRVYQNYVTTTFEIIDKDKKQFLIPDQLSKAFEQFAVQAKVPAPQKAQVQKIFEKYDANKDLKIDFKEFSKMASELFNIEVIPTQQSPTKPKDAKTGALQDIEEDKDEHLDKVEELDEKGKERKKNAEEYERYVEETGLGMAFKVIFAEILSKKIPEDAVFAYTAARLRQIGEDIAFIQNSKYKKEF